MLGRDFGFPLRPADERGRTYVVSTVCARRLLLSGIQHCVNGRAVVGNAHAVEGRIGIRRRRR